MGTFIFITIIIGAAIIFISERAKKVREEMIDEAREEGDEKMAEELKDMSDEEIFNNYEDRF